MKKKNLSDFVNLRDIIYLKVIDEESLYNLQMNKDYVVVRLPDDYVTMIPVEQIFPEYFKNLERSV